MLSGCPYQTFRDAPKVPPGEFIELLIMVEGVWLMLATRYFLKYKDQSSGTPNLPLHQWAMCYDLCFLALLHSTLHIAHMYLLCAMCYAKDLKSLMEFKEFWTPQTQGADQEAIVVERAALKRKHGVTRRSENSVTVESSAYKSYIHSCPVGVSLNVSQGRPWTSFRDVLRASVAERVWHWPSWGGGWFSP